MYQEWFKKFEKYRKENCEYCRKGHNLEIYGEDFDLKPKRHIIFAVDKTISVCEENENELAINRDYFTMQELKAINKKCEELGWI